MRVVWTNAATETARRVPLELLAALGLRVAIPMFAAAAIRMARPASMEFPAALVSSAPATVFAAAAM